MDPSPTSKEVPKATATLFSPFSNVSASTLKKHQPPPTAALELDLLYRECLRNHAASLGGHALDGCGEFMPSPASDPTVPTSLRCVACGCHRNFHRRLPNPLPLHIHGRGHDRGGGRHENEDEDEEHHQNEKVVEEDLHRSSVSPQPPLTLYVSAPHMLMALSAGLPGASPVPVSAAPPQPVRPVAIAATAAATPRKRSRTKFRAEQKERMMELSERLAWRMLKRDKGLVEEACREIGVDKGVFKVWMHNNKHNYWAFSHRDSPASAAAAGGGAGGSSSSADNDGGGNVSAFERLGNDNGNDNGNGGGNGGFSDRDSHYMNGFSSSS